MKISKFLFFLLAVCLLAGSASIFVAADEPAEDPEKYDYRSGAFFGATPVTGEVVYKSERAEFDFSDSVRNGVNFTLRFKYILEVEVTAAATFDLLFPRTHILRPDTPQNFSLMTEETQTPIVTEQILTTPYLRLYLDPPFEWNAYRIQKGPLERPFSPSAYYYAPQAEISRQDDNFIINGTDFVLYTPYILPDLEPFQTLSHMDMFALAELQFPEYANKADLAQELINKRIVDRRTKQQVEQKFLGGRRFALPVGTHTVVASYDALAPIEPKFDPVPIVAGFYRQNRTTSSNCPAFISVKLAAGYPHIAQATRAFNSGNTLEFTATLPKRSEDEDMFVGFMIASKPELKVYVPPAPVFKKMMFFWVPVILGIGLGALITGTITYAIVRGRSRSKETPE